MTVGTIHDGLPAGIDVAYVAFSTSKSCRDNQCNPDMDRNLDANAGVKLSAHGDVKDARASRPT